MCMGPLCKVTCSNTTFNRCTVVVLNGASVSLQNPEFLDMGKSVSLVSMYAHGQGSNVRINGGSISGGIQGIAVQAGAQVEASELKITAVEVTGIEVNDPGSIMRLTGGQLQEFSTRYDGRHVFGGSSQRSYVCTPDRRGVHAHSGGTVDFCTVSISGMWRGVCVYKGSQAKLTDCRVSDTDRDCLLVASDSTAVIESCSIAGCKASNGISVSGPGSSVHAALCNISSNYVCGAVATNGGKLVLDRCKSYGNGRGGYVCEDAGSSIEMYGCSSDNDAYGCSVTAGAKLVAEKALICSSENNGFDVDSSEAVLVGCKVSGCNETGIFMNGLGGNAKLIAEGCIVERNGQCGIIAGRNTTAVVTRCRTQGNRTAGCKARWRGAHMTLQNCKSNDDSCAFTTDDGGVLVMREVSVNNARPVSGQID